MGRGALVLYLNTPENAEVAGDAGIPFEASGLTEKLTDLVKMPCEKRAEWGERAMARVAEHYSWDAVTLQYEALLLHLRTG
jgi:glycosyltransferase involved in cell wall biosynthesis